MKKMKEELPEFLVKPDPNTYLSENFVVLDFETTNLDKGDPNNPDNRLVLAVWYDNSTGETFSQWGSEYEMGELVRACERADFIVAHNAKFELGWLKRCGLDISNIVSFCTQIGEYVLLGNRHKRLTLNACAERRGLGAKEGLVSAMIDNGICPSEIPEEWLEKYCRQDVALGTRLLFAVRQELQEEDMLPLVYTRCLFTPVLVDLESKGVHLAKDRVEALYRRYYRELSELQIRMAELTGGINTASGKQVGKYLYETLGFKIPKDYRGNPMLTPKGAPKTDSETISKLVPKTRKQKEFINLYRQINEKESAMSKTIRPFYECVTQTPEGVLYANFNQTVTSTHRLSSTGKRFRAQLQNIARTLKPLVSARNPEWLIGEADEGQLEYRAAVELGRDAQGRKDIADGVDAHAFTASIIYPDEWSNPDISSKARKSLRTAAKAHTFKPLYGGESGTENERAYYKAFKEKHKGITALQERWKSEVLNTKKLKTVTGLKFYWPDTRVTRSGYVTNTTSICNYPVQNLATAEIVPVGVTYLWHRMRANNMQSFLTNTVHDSAVAEIFPPERELFSDLAVKAFTEDVILYLREVYEIDFETPLEAEVEFNTHWANSEEWEQEFLLHTEK